MKEMLGGCCVCADENGWTDNPLIYCDGPNCEVAVHQGCYGIQEVPDGEWLCAKCNASSSTAYTNGSHKSFRCELCPSSYGALKRTDQKGWTHVICALYIPEVRFGDVHSMEPVILSDVPHDRFDRICYICDLLGAREDAKRGACMSCNKNGCKRSFHVTCAQQKGLLCEEGGISKNVKYCGYCENHLRKAQNDPSIKVIPACPATRLSQQQLPTTPPSSNNSAHMLVDPLPRPEQVNSVLGLGGTHQSSSTASSSASEDISTSSSASSVNVLGSTTTFSPPLTTSSRSSVALDPTPPLGTLTTSTQSISNGTEMTSHHLIAGANAETPIGAHLQHIQQAQSAVAAATSTSSNSIDGQNGIYGAHSNYLANELSRLPGSMAGFLPGEFHLNGGADMEEKTVKAVLTAPLGKAKRLRETKAELLDKGPKRPRANARPSAALNAISSQSSANAGTVGKSASMQRLISLVAPVVSETVSDFQRDRIADRTAAERRAAAAMSAPSTSTNGSTTTNGQAELVANGQGPSGNVIPSHSMQMQLQNGSQSINGSSSVRSHSTLPSSMEQLLERQWEQGSQLLLSHAHFDVAQLLTCLHQLKNENIRLEDQLGNLTKRREHLMALNARLAQPLGPSASNASTSAAHPNQIAAQIQAQVNNVTSPTHHSPLAANSVHQSGVDEIQQLRSLAIGTSQQISRPTPTHPPVVSSSAASLSTTPSTTFASTQNSIAQNVIGTPNNRATPSTAGQSLAATPIMSAATSNTATNLVDFSNAERMAQMSVSGPLLNSIYRNNMLDNTILTQLMMNPAYLQNNALTNNMLSRIMQQPNMVAAAAAALVNASNSHSTQQGTASASSNGK